MKIQSFTCPRCLRTSYDPHDVEVGYCGACHDWTGDINPGVAAARAMEYQLPFSEACNAGQHSRCGTRPTRGAVTGASAPATGSGHDR